MFSLFFQNPVNFLCLIFDNCINNRPNDQVANDIEFIRYSISTVLEPIIVRIVDLVKNKLVEGITDLRDESNREGMRIVIELKKDAVPEVVLNQLYKLTQLQTSFGANMLAIVDGEPRVLGLKEILNCYLLHQEDVLTRRSKYRLNKANDRIHILQGLRVACDNIDEIIKLCENNIGNKYLTPTKRIKITIKNRKIY